MATWLRQSTSIDVSIGPFVDNADGVTPETGLTITQPDIRLKKNGGAWAQKNAAQTLSHEENGWYEVALDTTDTNTLGNLLLAVNESGALPVWREFQVVTAQVWDSFFGADKLQVHADEITAGLITAAAIATGAIDADALAADAVAEIADAVWDEQWGDHLISGSEGELAFQIIAGVNALPQASAVADAVWDEMAGEHQSQNSFGQAIGDPDGAVSTIYGMIDTVENLPDSNDVSSAVWDDSIEGLITAREAMRLSNAALGGKLSGAGTGTEAVRDLADTKDRLIYTVDDQGNRTAVTRDLT